ncbi:Gamma-glutamyl-gamma-aminobutyrate hydrolase family protein [Candidatus Trichorickettsia mobilis]|uniref:Gamma-glutamyl-gamma-aminobutyrate hydrolase family protein n=1 Tax=Candidatus Trichorickettsia mobilis TaxID=1346319 RepID=A0ABZ0US56_9RICK|nr:gamma-glutamyl-gamma-aminobutyrate hydrolase family protein [Candidatus Trichorickettsia mobilis]WPY00651.1 Gamma-glutamyl-gamma-aminobutyrate hydrolase family protein [Candidatus Trichorickettsia mobilis]
MRKKPVIGIVLDLAEDSEKYRYSSFPWYVLRQNYVASIIKAGGIAIMIPYQIEAIAEVLDIVDGLIIPGSDEDIHPKFYHQEINSKYVEVRNDDEKTDFELAILQKAIERDLPFLGICHGMQLLNIFFGGDLIQHIPDYISSTINHKQPDTKNTPAHNINIVEGSILSKLTANKEVMINSNHHQALGKIGDGLIITATAADNIVEAIESPQHKFVLGVQWHPEYLNANDIDFAIFKGLVEAATENL